jgi:hypothetical protein
MFVSAAIAAYLPPLAFVPQMQIATNRPPKSRAVFAATKNNTTNGSSACSSKSVTTHSRCSKIPRLQCRWRMGRSALENRRHRKNCLLGQAHDPRRGDRRSKKVRRIKARSNYNADEEVLFPGFGAFGYYGPRYRLECIPKRIRLGRPGRGELRGWHTGQKYRQARHSRSSQCRTHPLP